jgi:hypothetical protein
MDDIHSECEWNPVDIQRQTWSQYMIKANMGLWSDCSSLRICFHWKFWSPLEAIGGKVYFGLYVEYDRNEFRKSM